MTTAAKTQAPAYQASYLASRYLAFTLRLPVGAV
jgi:hypothetical protein